MRRLILCGTLALLAQPLAAQGRGEVDLPRLPEPIRPSEMLEEQQVSPPASFDGDRNVAQDDALRAGG